MKSSSASHAPQVNSSKTGVEAIPIACRASSLLVRAIRTADDRSGTTSCAAVLPERLAEPLHALGRGRRRVGLDEDRIAESDLEVIESVPDQGLERHRIDVVGLDALEDLIVELDRLIVRQAQQNLQEAAVGVAAVQLEMDLAQSEAAAEIDAARPALDRVVVRLDGRRPVMRALLIQAAIQDAVGLFRPTRSGGRGRIHRNWPGRRIGPGDRGSCRRPGRSGTTTQGAREQAAHRGQSSRMGALRLESSSPVMLDPDLSTERTGTVPDHVGGTRR